MQWLCTHSDTFVFDPPTLSKTNTLFICLKFRPSDCIRLSIPHFPHYITCSKYIKHQQSYSIGLFSELSKVVLCYYLFDSENKPMKYNSTFLSYRNSSQSPSNKNRSTFIVVVVVVAVCVGGVIMVLAVTTLTLQNNIDPVFAMSFDLDLILRTKIVISTGGSMCVVLQWCSS